MQMYPLEFLDLIGNGDERDEMTFCMWCTNEIDEWKQNETIGNDGGKEYLLGYIEKSAIEWYDWAKYYYEINLDIDAVHAIYNGEPITETIINKINPKRNIVEALQEIEEMQ